MEKNKLNRSDFQILLRMLAGARLLEQTGNYVMLLNDESGQVYCTSFMTRKNPEFEKQMRADDIEVLTKIVSKREKDALTRSIELYKKEDFEGLWKLLVGQTTYKNGVLKGITTGVVLRECKRAYVKNNNVKNGQTNITTLSLLNVSDNCIQMAEEAIVVFKNENSISNYFRKPSMKTAQPGSTAKNIIESKKNKKETATKSNDSHEAGKGR